MRYRWQNYGQWRISGYAATREIIHEGNEQALREYIIQNKVALETELRELKESKQLALKRCRDSALPVWLHWLDDHDAEFRALLERATEDRKRYNKRVQPLSSAVSNAVLRIRPSARNNVCGVQMLVRRPSGWYCCCQGQVRVVGYMSAIGTDVNFVALRQAASGHAREFEFDLATPVSQQASPVAKALESHGLQTSEQFDLYSVTFKLARQSAREVTLVLLTCTIAPPVPARARAAKHYGADEQSESEPDEVGLLHHNISSESSLCSEEESAMSSSSCGSGGSEPQSVDDVPGAGGESSDDDVGAKARAAHGSYTQPLNAYFSLTNQYWTRDLKIRILDRWKSDTLLGTKLMSKSMQPAAFGESKDNPVRTKIVLRAWMVHRAQENGFSSSKACRRNLFAREVETLRREIQELSSAARPSTGNAATDAKIRSLLPQLLEPH